MERNVVDSFCLFDSQLTNEFREFVKGMGWEDQFRDGIGMVDILCAFITLKEVRLRFALNELSTLR